MSSSGRYQYQPLLHDHFRLLTLSPGTSGDSIKIRITPYELLNAPAFTALSYCWNDELQDLLCDCEPSQFVSITPTLDQVLRRCRSEKDEAHIWIDQICIDQRSEADKVQQVRLMRAIYSHATNVMIWLGAADETTRLVYELVNQVGREIMRTIRSSPGASFHDPDDPGKIYVPLNLSSADEPEWLAFRKLLSRPWFERTWTFQELVLAKQAYLWCGQYKTSWNQFVMVCKTVDTWDMKQKDAASHLKGTTEHLNFMSHCAMSWLQKGKRPEFEALIKPWAKLGSLLKNAMKLKASLGHDKVYGILGVAEDTDAAHFPINYEAPLREVYAHVTKHLIAQHRDLAPLSLKSVVPEVRPRIGPESLPSWIPDYRYDRSEFENRRLFTGPKPLHRGRERSYNATGLSGTDIVVDSDLDLHLRGVLVSRIKILSEPSGNMSGLQSISNNVLTDGSWQHLARKHSRNGDYIFTNETIDLAYARTRVCDYLPGETRPQHRMSREQLQPQRLEPEPSSLVITSNGEKLLSSQLGDVLTARILASTTGQRLAFSDEGHMCLCHQNCIQGDELWLITGADMPYVLRKLETSKYHFMGEAYVHGIMDVEHLIRRYKHTTLAGTHLSNMAWLETLTDNIEFPTCDVVLI